MFTDNARRGARAESFAARQTINSLADLLAGKDMLLQQSHVQQAMRESKDAQKGWDLS